MNHPHVFISFSSRDIKYSREMMSGLKSQNISFWDYSDDINEIELGENIPDKLKKEIDECDFFIPLISCNSTDPDIGKFTHFEVKYAIDIGLLDDKKIIPIILMEDRPVELHGAYNDLRYISHVELSLENTHLYIKALARICQSLEVNYVPIIEAHPRLPFWQFFRDEVIKLAQSNASHVRLLTIIGEFNEEFQKGNWDRAYFLISHFISCCQYEIPDYDIFYPLVVKAVCAQQLNMIDAAMETYRHAGNIRPHDENVFGGLGSLYFEKKDYLNAKKYFKEALRYCPDNENVDERINYIIALIESGDDIPDKLKDFLFTLDISLFPKEERYRVINTQCAVYYSEEKYNEVILIYREMERTGILDTTSIVYYHLSFIAINKLEEAKTILWSVVNNADAYERVDIITIYHYLSDLLLNMGEIDKAVEIYKIHLLNPEHRTRQFMIKYSRILKHVGKFRKMQKVCADILSGKIFPTPGTPEDFYYDGFAQYLLGNIERAKYDFERSDNFDLFYSEYED